MFHPRWLLPSRQQQAALTASLLSQRQPIERRAAAAGTGLTRDDRRMLLAGEFRAVADLGATSEALYDEARKGVAALLASLRRGVKRKGDEA